MKTISKVAIGVVLGLTICALFALATAIWITPSKYDKCWAKCVAEAEDKLVWLADSGEEFADLMIQIKDVDCPRQCKGYYQGGAVAWAIDQIDTIFGRLRSLLWY